MLFRSNGFIRLAETPCQTLRTQLLLSSSLPEVFSCLFPTAILTASRVQNDTLSYTHVYRPHRRSFFRPAVSFAGRHNLYHTHPTLHDSIFLTIPNNQTVPSIHLYPSRRLQSSHLAAAHRQVRVVVRSDPASLAPFLSFNRHPVTLCNTISQAEDPTCSLRPR